jgi:hypothetical protein
MGTMWLHDWLEILAITLHEKKRQGITIRDSINTVKMFAAPAAGCKKYIILKGDWN